MSLSTPTLRPARAAGPDRSPAAAARSRAIAVALACLVFGAAGGLRLWREARIQAQLRHENDVAPIRLAALPRTLGGGEWVGEDMAELDERIIDAVQSTDYVQRRYVNQRTGASVVTVIFRGPALAMSLHPPEICYPNAGYRQAGYPLARTVPLEGPHGPAGCRALLYARPGGVGDEFDEVLYTRRIRGRWSADLAAYDYKELQRTPTAFKVYVQRRIAPSERAVYEQGLASRLESPGEAFLRILLPELEAMLAARGRGPAAAASPTPAHRAPAPSPPGRAG